MKKNLKLLSGNDDNHQDRLETQPDLTKNINEASNGCDDVPKIVSDNQIVVDDRVPSPIQETVLIVPTIKWDQLKRNKCLDSDHNFDSDSLSLTSSSGTCSDFVIVRKQLEIPRVEIRNSKGDLMEDDILIDNLNIGILELFVSL